MRPHPRSRTSYRRRDTSAQIAAAGRLILCAPALARRARRAASRARRRRARGAGAGGRRPPARARDASARTSVSLSSMAGGTSLASSSGRGVTCSSRTRRTARPAAYRARGHGGSVTVVTVPGSADHARHREPCELIERLSTAMRILLTSALLARRRRLRSQAPPPARDAISHPTAPARSSCASPPAAASWLRRRTCARCPRSRSTATAA